MGFQPATTRAFSRLRTLMQGTAGAAATAAGTDSEIVKAVRRPAGRVNDCRDADCSCSHGEHSGDSASVLEKDQVTPDRLSGSVLSSTKGTKNSVTGWSASDRGCDLAPSVFDKHHVRDDIGHPWSRSRLFCPRP
jgi:hypothetical protein